MAAFLRVSDLRIENFRGIRNGSVRFKKHTMLVGPNNAGKTTIIEALALLLGRDRLVRELTEHDFYGSDPAPKDRIKLIATITDFEENDPDAHSDWFRDNRAVPKWLDDETGAVHAARHSSALKLCCQIGFQAFFDREALTVETSRYFHDDEIAIDPFADDGVLVGVPTPLLRDVGFYLVRSSRTWEGALSFGSDLFRRVVRVADGQPAAAVLAERDRLRHPAEPIDADPRLSPLVAEINAELGRLLPRQPQVRFRVTATDSRAVLEALVAHFAIADRLSVPAAREGSGLVSLQILLLLLQLGRTRATAGEGFMMALEEPELHVPPPIQRQLVLRIQALSAQTIITSHAPSVAAVSEPTSVLMVRNDSGQLRAEPLLGRPLEPSSPSWIRKFFHTGRPALIAALMHETVLIPEGRSDHELIHAIANALALRQHWTAEAGRSFILEVGLIPTEDAQVVLTYETIARLHGRVCCLVDGDAAGASYAAALLASRPQPAAILCWPQDWAVEHAVSWILQADEAAAVAAISGALNEPSLASIAQIVDSLLAHKNDIVRYEAIATVIAETAYCAARARELLRALADACVGEATVRFARDASGVLMFQP
jgi:putative ATP-dependent endonuclease of the OLD family